MATRRRVEVEFTGRSGNIEALLNRLNTGISRVTRTSGTANRELGLIDKQLMAIGTTARYAFAGSFVFGITGAITRLTEFQNRLGEVAALASTVGAGGTNVGRGNQFLENVGDQAILEANKVGVATEDIQAYMTRFFSAFDTQRMGGRRAIENMRGFTDEVARLQAMLGPEAGDPQQLAGGIAGFVNQMPGGTRNIPGSTNQVANLIWNMLRQTPNVTGRDISRDIGRVGASMQIANMTPAQAFAVWGTAGMAGGSASVIGRGVSQLLGSSLLHPNTPEQLQAFQQAGLPTDPTQLRNMGGMQVLQQMMNAVAPGGTAKLSRQDLGLLAGAGGAEDVTDEDVVNKMSGIGVNLTLLYNLLGRQESVRQFINLLGQGGTRALDDWIKSQDRATKTNDVRSAEDRALGRRQLASFSIARQNISLGLARGAAWPLEHLVAPPVIAASNQLAEHRRVTQALEGALGAYLGQRAIRGLLGPTLANRGGRLGAFGAILGRGGNSRMAAAAGAAITAEQMPALLAGGTADGSRESPFWVVISPASGALDPRLNEPTGSGKGGDGSNRPPLIPAWMKGALGLSAGATALGVTEAVALPFLASGAGGANRPRGHGAFSLDPRGQRSLAQLGRPELADPLLAALHAAQRPMGGFQKITFEGQANADLTIRLTDAQGKTITVQEKKGVPVKLWGAPGAPTTQGKPGQRKGTR